MSVDVSQAAVIEGLLPRLRAEGYEVFVHPRGPIIPSFLGSYQPDVIALRADRNLAIEVRVPRLGEKSDKLRGISALFEAHQDWEFRVILATPENLPAILTKQSRAEIVEKFAEMERLIEGGHFEASFLLAWAIFEALGRSLLEARFQWPQTPGRLIEILASEGILTPSEADILRPLAARRNKLVHGEFNIGVSPEDAQSIRHILGKLLEIQLH